MLAIRTSLGHHILIHETQGHLAYGTDELDRDVIIEADYLPNGDLYGANCRVIDEQCESQSLGHLIGIHAKQLFKQ